MKKVPTDATQNSDEKVLFGAFTLVWSLQKFNVFNYNFLNENYNLIMQLIIYLCITTSPNTDIQYSTITTDKSPQNYIGRVTTTV